MSLLTVDSVADYVLKHAAQINVFPADAELTAEAIQGGNVNFAFCVRSSCGKSVFVKQAPEYVAVFGPNGLPLTSTRIQKEVSILVSRELHCSDYFTQNMYIKLTYLSLLSRASGKQSWATMQINILQNCITLMMKTKCLLWSSSKDFCC